MLLLVFFFPVSTGKFTDFFGLFDGLCLDLLQLNSGKVVAVGPGLRDKSGNTIPVAVKEGDTVLLPEYGGTQVKLGEKEYHLYRDEDILGTLHD